MPKTKSKNSISYPVLRRNGAFIYPFEIGVKIHNTFFVKTWGPESPSFEVFPTQVGV